MASSPESPRPPGGPGPAPRRESSNCRSLLAAVALTALLGALLASGSSLADARGAEAQLRPFDLESLDLEPRFARWGVVGKGPSVHATEVSANGRYTGPQPEVWDIEQIGDRVFVGGIFTGVRRNEFWFPGDEIRPQPWLAAFDLDGDWIETFTPALDGGVYELATGPDGNLLVGGEFTSVNGIARSGLAALDPITGDVDTSFDAGVTRPNSPKPAYIKELEVVGPHVYVAGTFTQVISAGVPNASWGMARLDATTGEHDPGFAPRPSGGGVWDFAIDDRRGWVHLVGYFAEVTGAPDTESFATVSIDDGSVVEGLPQFPLNDPIQRSQLEPRWLGAESGWVVATTRPPSWPAAPTSNASPSCLPDRATCRSWSAWATGCSWVTMTRVAA